MVFSKLNSIRSQAFSLVEVVIALGVTSFAVLALIGTLPTGIKSVQDSSNESARANILQQIRAQLQEVNFGSSAADNAAKNNIANLASQSNYYNNEGDLLANSSGAYYMAVFSTGTAAIPSTSSSATYFQTNAAQAIQVVLSYPCSAPASSQVQSTNYLLAAKQKSY
jgi:uncharacterized protein (TIGR02598 family)